MKKIYLLLLVLAASTSGLTAQQLDVKWTEKLKFENKIDGFFDYYIGTNDQYVYAKFSNYAINPNKLNRKVKIVAFDKNSFKKEADVRLIGYGDSKDKEKDDMDYYKTILLDNVLYVVWVKEDKKRAEFFAETFTPQLKKISKLKKIYELSVGKKGTDNLVLIYNNKLDNRILIGRELAVQSDNESLKFEYNLLDQNLAIVANGMVTTPVMLKKKPRKDASYTNTYLEYILGEDGKLYITDYVSLSEQERKNARRNEATAYPVFMQVNMEKASIKSYDVKFSEKNTFRFSILITKNGPLLFGFFSDLNKDAYGTDLHGIFYLPMGTDFAGKAPKFTYFDKNFLDQLFAKDKEDQKKGRSSNSDSKKSDDESLDNYFVIEAVKEIDNDVVLFCCKRYNYSVTTCDAKGNCVTNYYCNKKNVTAFRMSQNGGMVWASNLDREITYSGTNVHDLAVARDGNNFFVTYGSAYNKNENGKKKKKKKGEQLRDRFEYAVFDASNGQYKKQECVVNKVNAPKSERKRINASNIVELDDLLYLDATKKRLRYITWVACAIFPPSYYCFALSGNARVGTGYLGMIKPVK